MTRLNPSQQRHLQRVIDARTRIDQARKRTEQVERRARTVALRAVTAGVPVSRVAESLGVARMTLYRWASANEKGPATEARPGPRPHRRMPDEVPRA